MDSVSKCVDLRLTRFDRSLQREAAAPDGLPTGGD